MRHNTEAVNDPDRIRANELKAELQQAAASLLAAMDKCRVAGFLPNFACNYNVNTGVHELTNLVLSKNF